MVSDKMLIVLSGLKNLSMESLDAMCQVSSCMGQSCHDCPVNSPATMANFVNKTLEENGHD